jgi:hypothetical protein
MAAWQCPRAMAATRALNKEAVDVMANLYIQTRFAVESTRYLPRDSVSCGVGVGVGVALDAFWDRRRA